MAGLVRPCSSLTSEAKWSLFCLTAKIWVSFLHICFCLSLPLASSSPVSLNHDGLRSGSLSSSESVSLYSFDSVLPF